MLSGDRLQCGEDRRFWRRMEVTVVCKREWTEGHRTGHLKMVHVVTLTLTAFHHNEKDRDSLGERPDVDKKLPRGGTAGHGTEDSRLGPAGVPGRGGVCQPAWG